MATITTDRARRVGATAIGLAAALLSVPATAQEDVQRVSVLDRARPDYDPLGIRVGTLVLYPSVGLSGTYSDNIFALDANSVDDGIFVLNPQLQVDYSRGSSAATLTVESVHERYASRDTENSDDLFGRGTFRSALDATTLLTGGINVLRRAEDRRSLGSFTLAARPVRFTSLESQIGLQKALGSLRLEGIGRVRRASYSEGLDQNGQPLDYAFRNFKVYQGTGRVGYSRTGASQVYIAGTYNRRVYDLRPGDPGFDPLTRLDRSSSGWRVEAGYSRQISALLFATGQVGYLRQNFADRQLRTIDGLSFVGSLLWNLSPLTSVSARAERTVDETITPLAAGNLRSEIAARVDHELLRNVIISADGRFADIEPSGLNTSLVNNPAARALSLESQEYEIGGSGRYRANRIFSFTVDVRHRARSSNNNLIAFDENTVTLGVRAGL